MCTTFTDRVELMRAEDEPQFANWDQDAEVAATAFGRVGDDEWLRRDFRSNGSDFTVDSLGRYFLHDLHYQVWDIRGLRTS